MPPAWKIAMVGPARSVFEGGSQGSAKSEDRTDRRRICASPESAATGVWGRGSYGGAVSGRAEYQRGKADMGALRGPPRLNGERESSWLPRGEKPFPDKRY